MWRDDSAPRTTAERLRAARRDEIAALYNQSIERQFNNKNNHNNLHSTSERLVGSNKIGLDTYLCARSRGGQLCEDGVPVMKRLMQGEYQNERNVESKCMQTVNTENIIPSSLSLSLSLLSPSEVGVADTVCTDTSFDAASLNIKSFEKPIKVLNKNWSRSEMCRKRHWCTYGTPHSAATTTVNGMKTSSPELLQRPASASTLTTTTTMTTRNRPGSSASIPSSLMTHRTTNTNTNTNTNNTTNTNTTANTNNTMTTRSMLRSGAETARNGRSSMIKGRQQHLGKSYRCQSTQPQQKNNVNTSSGGLLLSKDEYRRIRELITPL
ncbi:uncharacterized protein TM35_000461380 [Trypanosoma theileri]|uniref:Uncharacterized protein n=1 Tax=Trypanosoma theileri TaxID=67003 RepID=A0A1X0NJG2_9TRYP|nr:uncharacterized protein TM35_000461380 [Trypanosoma theileri]ORC84319.1 hypothetical protein TM35_000461380 [Trypanosoma theileri]